MSKNLLEQCIRNMKRAYPRESGYTALCGLSWRLDNAIEHGHEHVYFSSTWITVKEAEQLKKELEAGKHD